MQFWRHSPLTYDSHWSFLNNKWWKISQCLLYNVQVDPYSIQPPKALGLRMDLILFISGNRASLPPVTEEQVYLSRSYLAFSYCQNRYCITPLLVLICRLVILSIHAMLINIKYLIAFWFFKHCHPEYNWNSLYKEMRFQSIPSNDVLTYILLDDGVGTFIT